ncbi:MAG: GntR family transcriptional regulator [bacterium]|nr:GntR family transcriptional regulator [bacterium]
MKDRDLLRQVSTIQTVPSLREQVATWLRSALFTGDLGPGSTFSVPALAEQFGISATPVREAVLDLVQQGLVVAVPSKGFLVVNPSSETIEQSVEIRRLVEVPTNCRIAEWVMPEDLAPLRIMAKQILTHAREVDLRSFVEVDYLFHRGVTGLAGNPMLTDLVEDLRSRARVVTVPYIASKHLLIKAAHEHKRLLDAMQARDMADVKAVTEQHMSYALAQAAHTKSG